MKWLFFFFNQTYQNQLVAEKKEKKEERSREERIICHLSLFSHSYCAHWTVPYIFLEIFLEENIRGFSPYNQHDSFFPLALNPREEDSFLLSEHPKHQRSMVPAHPFQSLCSNSSPVNKCGWLARTFSPINLETGKELVHCFLATQGKQLGTTKSTRKTEGHGSQNYQLEKAVDYCKWFNATKAKRSHRTYPTCIPQYSVGTAQGKPYRCSALLVNKQHIRHVWT